MNSNYYTNATIAYNSGDYVKALEGFYNCLTTDTATFEAGDAGLVYHRLGNCLVKVERFEEAISIYRRSLEDPDYGERGSIHVNLGTALSALDRYDEAIEEFNSALADENYSTPYRAYMGLGNALSKQNRIVEAGTAYRTAALDASNPNPVKALMNLGASFSALDRPLDAVEAYLAILDFKVTGLTLNKTYERLGGAYFAAGKYEPAITAFNDAMAAGNYLLSERSLNQLDEAIQALLEPPKPDSPDDGDKDESAFVPNDSLAVRSPMEDSSSLQPLDADITGSFGMPAETSSENNPSFFTASDAELIAAGKRQYKSEKKLRNTGLKVLFAVLAVLVLALGVAIIAFVQGYGMPSQQTTVKGFFDSYAAGREVSGYWVDGAMDDPIRFDRMLLTVVHTDSSRLTIRQINRSISESQAYVDVQTPEGGIVHYRVALARDGIGWKINGIELVFASKN